MAAFVGPPYEIILDNTTWFWGREDPPSTSSAIFLLAIIGLELLDTVFMLLKEALVHVETVHTGQEGR